MFVCFLFNLRTIIIKKVSKEKKKKTRRGRERLNREKRNIFETLVWLSRCCISTDRHLPCRVASLL